MIIEIFIASLNSAKILEIKKITKNILTPYRTQSKNSSPLFKGPSNSKTLKKHSRVPFQIKILSPLDAHFPLKNLTPLEEKGITYEENARLKASWLKNLMTHPVNKEKNLEKTKTHFSFDKNKVEKHKTFFLGEDSGLEIEALKGFPGLFSARFANQFGLDSSQLLNQKSPPIAEILKKLHSLKGEKRKASFKSTMVCLDTDGKEKISKGILEGKIHEKSKGENGFGYDSVFIPNGESLTLSEMESNQKNKISHRAKALMNLLKTLNPLKDAHLEH